MRHKVSIIILNWNGRKYLAGCLSSVLAQTYPHYEVVLVDNASTDGSVELVTQKFPTVRIIRNDVNLGFAAGNNQAIKVTSGEYAATLNNDTKVDPDWLAELVKAIQTDARAGMAASKMLFQARPQVIDSAGLAPDLAGIAWNWRSGEDDQGGFEPREVFGPCAGAALYRREMLDQIGLFDEDFFAYLEDADLAWRARLAGWKCLYVPTAKVYHVHSATGVEGSAFKSYLLGRNKLWIIIKNYPLPELLLYWPLIAFYDLMAVIYHLLVRGDLSPLRGRLAALKGLPAMLSKRREIQGRRVIPFSELKRLMAPLQSPLTMWGKYRRLQEVIPSPNF